MLWLTHALAAWLAPTCLWRHALHQPQVHKLLQGLLDQYSLAGQEQALGMAEGMASYFCGR